MNSMDIYILISIFNVVFTMFDNRSLPQLTVFHLYVEHIHRQTTKRYKGLRIKPTLQTTNFLQFCKVKNESSLFPRVMRGRSPTPKGARYHRKWPHRGGGW